MKTEIAAIATVAAIVVGVGIGYLTGAGTQRTITTISTTTLPGTTVTTGGSTASLQIFASVRPSSITSGKTIAIVAGVYNPINIVVTIRTSEISNPSENPCGNGVVPTGIRIYSGHYAFANLSRASPLLLYNATIPPPCGGLGDITYTFQPNSFNAIISTSPGTSLAWMTNRTVTESGYWTSGPPGGPYAFHSFGPGPYMVIVFDAWGQQLLEYFDVT